MILVGLGQGAAGDDGVGLVVLRALVAAGLPEGVTAVEIRDAAPLVDLLCGGAPVLLVDAVVGPPPGEVVVLDEAALQAEVSAVSTHALSVPAAVGLARALGGAAPLTVVGVGIAPPEGVRIGLSPEVEAAVQGAVGVVRRVIVGRRSGTAISH